MASGTGRFRSLTNSSQARLLSERDIVLVGTLTSCFWLRASALASSPQTSAPRFARRRLRRGRSGVEPVGVCVCRNCFVEAQFSEAWLRYCQRKGRTCETCMTCLERPVCLRHGFGNHSQKLKRSFWTESPANERRICLCPRQGSRPRADRSNSQPRIDSHLARPLQRKSAMQATAD